MGKSTSHVLLPQHRQHRHLHVYVSDIIDINMGVGSQSLRRIFVFIKHIQYSSSRVLDNALIGNKLFQIKYLFYLRNNLFHNSRLPDTMTQLSLYKY